MKSGRSLLGLLQIIIAVLLSSPLAADELCGVTFSGPAALLADLSKPRPDRISESDLFISVRGPTPLKNWTVTKPANPAHPSIVCREAAQKPDGSWTMVSEVSCGASETACKAMIAEFSALDEKMRKSIEEAHRK